MKGAQNIKDQFVSDSLGIFVSPPSIQELEKRLIGRGTESAVTLKTRLERAEMEMEAAKNFDTRIVNDELERAYQELKNIVEPFIKST